VTGRQQLLNRLGGVESPRPLVTLEEYFSGNDDQASIGDLDRQAFTPEQFFTVLKVIRARADVHDVRVEVKPPKTPDGWPSTDTIWIVTSLDRMDMFRHGLHREFWERFLPLDWLTYPRKDGVLTEPLEVPDGMYAWGFYYL
jgi:hypothetical protein